MDGDIHILFGYATPVKLSLCIFLENLDSSGKFEYILIIFPDFKIKQIHVPWYLAHFEIEHVWYYLKIDILLLDTRKLFKCLRSQIVLSDLTQHYTLPSLLSMGT